MRKCEEVFRVFERQKNMSLRLWQDGQGYYFRLEIRIDLYFRIFFGNSYRFVCIFTGSVFGF